MCGEVSGLNLESEGSRRELVELMGGTGKVSGKAGKLRLILLSGACVCCRARADGQIHSCWSWCACLMGGGAWAATAAAEMKNMSNMPDNLWFTVKIVIYFWKDRAVSVIRKFVYCCVTLCSSHTPLWKHTGTSLNIAILRCQLNQESIISCHPNRKGWDCQLCGC